MNSLWLKLQPAGNFLVFLIEVKSTAKQKPVATEQQSKTLLSENYLPHTSFSLDAVVGWKHNTLSSGESPYS